MSPLVCIYPKNTHVDEYGLLCEDPILNTNYIHTLRCFQRRSDEYAAGVAPRQTVAGADPHTVVFNAIASLVPPTPPVAAPSINPSLVPVTPGMDVPFPPTPSINSRLAPATGTADQVATVPTTPTMAQITASIQALAATRVAVGGMYI